MLDYYFETYKRYILSFFTVSFISIFTIFYFSEDKKVEKKQNIKKIIVNNKTTYKEAVVLKEKLIKKKEIVKRTSKKSEKIKKVILYSTKSNDNRYSLKLISDKKIKNLNSNSRYIVVTGSISDGYDESFFPMSINENYIEDTSILTFEIKDTKNSIKSICEGYFLDSLTTGFSYHIKIDLFENISDCYIVSQGDFEENIYSDEEKEYVEIKDGVMGILADEQIKISNEEDLKNMKINKILK